MMAGKVVSLGFEIISKLDSYFLMTVHPTPILDYISVRKNVPDAKKGKFCKTNGIFLRLKLLSLENNCLT